MPPMPPIMMHSRGLVAPVKNMSYGSDIAMRDNCGERELRRVRYLFAGTVMVCLGLIYRRTHVVYRGLFLERESVERQAAHGKKALVVAGIFAYSERN